MAYLLLWRWCLGLVIRKSAVLLLWVSRSVHHALPLIAQGRCSSFISEAPLNFDRFIMTWACSAWKFMITFRGLRLLESPSASLLNRPSRKYSFLFVVDLNFSEYFPNNLQVILLLLLESNLSLTGILCMMKFRDMSSLSCSAFFSSFSGFSSSVQHL